MAEFLRPLERTAALCGMRWDAPMVIHADQIEQASGPYLARLEALVAEAVVVSGAEPVLLRALVYLAAGVVAVPLAKRAGLGAVLGYLLAGILIGPDVLGLAGNAADVVDFAQFGVVILLFLIGLEVRPALLWQLRGSIFGLGAAQLLGAGRRSHSRPAWWGCRCGPRWWWGWCWRCRPPRSCSRRSTSAACGGVPWGMRASACCCSRTSP